MSDKKQQKYKQLKYKYMPDWYIVYSNNGFIIYSFSDKQLADYLLLDTILSIVGKALEKV